MHNSIQIIKTEAPAIRKGGAIVENVDVLLQKLRNEAKLFWYCINKNIYNKIIIRVYGLLRLDIYKLIFKIIDSLWILIKISNLYLLEFEYQLLLKIALICAILIVLFLKSIRSKLEMYW